MILGLYRALTTLLGPLLLLFLLRRRGRGKEDRVRFSERLGIASIPRPDGAVIWLHAASVGEAISMLPLIALLQQRHGTLLLVTTGTVTSAAVMTQRLPAGALHQFVPVDRPAWVRRFLDHWRPDLALWAESEFWPNLLRQTAARQIPMILLNGRISERSFRRWRRFPRSIARLLGGFVLCLAQTPTDAERLTALGAPASLCVGNLKFAAPALDADGAQLLHLRQAAGERPRWLALSTHDGEEALAFRLHRSLAGEFPDLLTIILPRHPDRGAAIAAELAVYGIAPAQRSLGQALAPDTAIYLADSLGEVGLFIRLAPLVFVGKSLIGQGGQNPLEPARLGASVLFGPHMGNFADIAARMIEARAACQVGDETALTAALRHRLRDPGVAQAEGERAHRFVSTEAAVLPSVIAAIAPWLPKADSSAGSASTRTHHAGA